jgi:maltose alpha-D-glucosyltransferase / alpha-amylase
MLAETRPQPTPDHWDPAANVVALAEREAPFEAHDTTEAYLHSAELLGRRVAELHMALGADSRDAAFRPESFTTLYQRSVYQSMRNLEQRNMRLLRQRLPVLNTTDRELAETILDRQADLTARLRTVIETPATGKRIRYHGDLHLGQVLGTGRDFVLIDFEGEPARSLADRRIKRSPLRDVAGMLRSFDYARHIALRDEVGRGLVEPGAEGYELLMQWGAQWCSWVSAAFLRAYLDTAAGASFLPDTREEVAVMLDAFVMEKAVYELGYELNTRPDWAGIPLAGILALLGTS